MRLSTLYNKDKINIRTKEMTFHETFKIKDLNFKGINNQESSPVVLSTAVAVVAFTVVVSFDFTER